MQLIYSERERLGILHVVKSIQGIVQKLAVHWEGSCPYALEPLLSPAQYCTFELDNLEQDKKS